NPFFSIWLAWRLPRRRFRSVKLGLEHRAARRALHLLAEQVVRHAQLPFTFGATDYVRHVNLVVTRGDTGWPSAIRRPLPALPVHPAPHSINRPSKNGD